MDEVGDRAGVFESLHDDEKRGEEKQQLPTYAAVDVFGLDAADDEDERGDGSCSERERKIQNPKNENEHGGDGAFREEFAIHDNGDGRRLMFEGGRVPELVAKKKREKGNVEKESE